MNRLFAQKGRGPQSGRLAYICLEDRFHLPEGPVILLGGVRGDAVGGDEDLEIAQISVIRREKNANVARHAGEDEAFDAEVAEKRVERRREKSGVLRFEDEVIVFLREELLHHRLANDSILQAVLDEEIEIGSPPAEVVIDVNRRDPGFLQPLFQPGDFPGHRKSLPKQLLPFGELEVVDHVNQQECARALVGRISMEIFASRSHGRTIPRKSAS